MPSLLKVLIRWALSVNGGLAFEALAVGCCKLVKEVFVLVGVCDGEVVDPNDDEEKRLVALKGEDAPFVPKVLEAIALQEVRNCLLPKMSALASIFKYHLQLANELLTCRLV
eukprot:3777159-Pleurochrysis_carterae.AAC.1